MKLHLAHLAAAAAALAFVAPALAQPQTAPAEGQDPFLWLEELNGARAMEWVRAENARTLKVLEADPRFKGLYDDALKIAEAKDRIPEPRFLDGAIFNFWQDSDHVRGVWRRTTVDDYKNLSPAGPPCWTSTPSPRPRKRTGSGRTPTAPGPRNAAAWSICRTAARTP